MRGSFLLVFLICLAVRPDNVFAQVSQSRPDWDKIVEAGRKGGKTLWSIPPTAGFRKLMEPRFPKRYGIRVEFLPGPRGAIIQRMVDESKAGVQYFDL